MIGSVKDFHQSFESHFKPNDDDQQRILDLHGDIALPSKYWELAEKLERYSPGYVDERKRQFADESYVSASKLKLANSVDIPQTKTTPEPEPEVESVRKSESESLADSKTNYKVNHEESSKSKLKRIRSQMNREGIAPLDIVLNSDKRELKGSEFAAASDKVIKALLANRNDRVCKFAANEDEGEVVRYVESLSCEFASSLVDLANLYLDAVDSQIKRGIDCDELEIMLDKVKEVLGLVEEPPRIKVNNNRIISAATAYKPDDYMDTQQRYSNTASALIARRIDRDRHEAEEIRAKEAARLEEVIARIEEEMSDLFSFVGDDCTHDEARKIMMALDQRTGGAKKEILMLEDELARIGIFKKKRKQEIHDTISKLRKSIQRNESMSSAIKEALERHYELEEKIASLRNTLEWL